MKIGTKVRFTRGPLGASDDKDNVCHIVSEMFGPGDVGVVAFPHPNRNNKYHDKSMRDSLAKTWYVEVESKVNPGQKLYVGEHEAHLQVVGRNGR